MSLFVVFDTNVIVSAMLSNNPNAPTVKVVEAISQEKVIPLYNEEILVEYRKVLHRTKFNLHPSIGVLRSGTFKRRIVCRYREYQTLS